MLKKLSTLITLPVFLAAAGSAFADQEVPSMAGSSSNQSVSSSSKSMHHTSSSKKATQSNSGYYGYNSMPKPTRYTAPPQFHLIVGGQLGYGFLNGNEVTGYTKDDDGNIFGGIFVGGDYMWNQYLATGLQLGYYYGPNLFKYKGNGGNSDITVKSTMLVPLLATAKVFLPMNFNVFIKGGVAYVNQDVENSAHVDYNGVLAGGVGYNWQNWDVFAEYMYVFGKDDALGDQNDTFPINAITLGVSYSFPF